MRLSDLVNRFAAGTNLDKGRRPEPMLLHGNFRALLTFRGEVLDALVDHLANRLEEFDARIREMLSHRGRNAQVGAQMIQELTTQASIVHDALALGLRTFLSFVHCASFISTVRT